jgi:hypothetical protein
MNTPEAATTENAATVAEQTPKTQSAPKGKKSASKKASKAAAMDPKTKKDAAAKKASKPAAGKSEKPKQDASKKPAKASKSEPREGSKKQIVIELMQRKDGATLAEIMKQTGWAPHSVRGFVSGQLAKKMGLKVVSAKNEARERTYRIER